MEREIYRSTSLLKKSLLKGIDHSTKPTWREDSKLYHNLDGGDLTGTTNFSAAWFEQAHEVGSCFSF